MITFFVCGLWHGVGLSFVVWGLLHGLYSAFDAIAGRLNWKFVRKGVIGRILTFAAVSFAWIFFRADSLEKALRYLQLIGTIGPRWFTFMAEYEAVGLDTLKLVILLVSLAVMIAADILAYRRGENIPELVSRAGFGLRCSLAWVLLAAVFLFGIYGPVYGGEQRLIYMGF